MTRSEFEYEGEKIWYDEDAKEWRWSGSGRGYAEPKNVREAIDRAQGKGKNGTPKFERQKALLWNHRGINEVNVTSQADGFEYWISSASGRSKERQSQLYAVTDENRAKIAEVQAKEKEIELLRQQMDQIRLSMQGFHEWLKEQRKGDSK